MLSQDKIQIHISKELKNIDRHRLLQSIVFFASHVFEAYANKFTSIMIDINNEDDLHSQGCFFVHNNCLHCCVHIVEIQKAILNKIGFNSFKRSLFFVLLHEIGHAIYCVENCPVGKSLEDFDNELNIEIKKIYDESKEPEMIASRLVKQEILADRFAYQNLSYFKNLYDTNAILVY